VRGYKEEGTTTTPFDMVMLNDLDRYHLVIDVIDRVPGLADRAGHLRQEMEDARLQARPTRGSTARTRPRWPNGDGSRRRPSRPDHRDAAQVSADLGARRS
jgi:phosphoketolase